MKIEGKWKKVSAEPCAEQYPDEIEFYDRPRFLAKKGPNQRFISWDAGSYEVGDNEVKLSTATDEIVAYKCDFKDDLLSFVDNAGCKFAYRRIS